MTIAVDKNTDEVIGQVVLAGDLREAGTIRVLTKDGYKILREEDVRVERVS